MFTENMVCEALPPPVSEYLFPSIVRSPDYCYRNPEVREADGIIVSVNERGRHDTYAGKQDPLALKQSWQLPERHFNLFF